MRTLSATLEAAQKATSVKPLVRLVLDRTGETTRTYTTSRILSVVHTESPWSQTAEVVLDNSDAALTSLDFEGYSGNISWGATTSAGAEYSICSTLYVTGRELFSAQGKLACKLSLVGIPNLLDADHASVVYTQGDDSTYTLEDLLYYILNASTISSFTHCDVYGVQLLSGDASYQIYKLRRAFRIALNDTRLQKVKGILKFTTVVMLPQSDVAGSLTLQFKVPTMTGESYDYEYSLASGEHGFWSKSLRSRIVIPNYIVVQSPPGSSPSYSGSASDSSSSYIEKRQFYNVPVADDAQATTIATAILQQFQVSADQGGCHAPMNVGAEVYDYVKVTDSRENDSRVGNIGWLQRHYKPGKWEMEFRLGAVDFGNLLGAIPPEIFAPTFQEVASHKLATIEATLSNVLTYLELLNTGQEFIPQSEMTTHGDILYHDGIRARRLAPDAGTGYMYLRSQGPGLPPVWEDLTDIIGVISGGENMALQEDRVVPVPTLNIPTAVVTLATKKTATATLAVPVPTQSAWAEKVIP